MNSPVKFNTAKIGETAYVYCVGHLGMDYDWVSETEWFDDFDEDVTVKRQLWQLVSEDSVTFKGYVTRHLLEGEDA